MQLDDFIPEKTKEKKKKNVAALVFHLGRGRRQMLRRYFDRVAEVQIAIVGVIACFGSESLPLI